jgi:2-aminobenzoylacetyl-CoA thioesterase
LLFTGVGPVKGQFYISGLAWFPVHLFDGRSPVLFEGGVTCAGEIYAEAIRSVLGTRQPEMLFLTHVHWDHCGAVSYLRKSFPSLKIAASRRAAEILKRQRARELIGRLNRNVKPLLVDNAGVDPSRLIDDAFEPFDVDMELADGRLIELEPGLTIEVLATPGHTNDHLSYYVPHEGILVASDASGCLDNAGNMIPQFLSDFDAYVSSLQRLASCRAEILCQGHRIILVGEEEVRTFFNRSIREAIQLRDRIHELLRAEEGSIDRVVQRIKAEQYDVVTGIKQPEGPYLLNLRAQVTHLSKRK